MKNILDKRQLGYKITANSLYGQCGAKTSTFYEPDIAASTTATGRLLLTYAKRVVEECYGDATVDSKYGSIQIVLMTGFKLWTSGVGSYCSNN